jgi:Fur family transcriptional regulator, ferric uptake regulator
MSEIVTANKSSQSHGGSKRQGQLHDAITALVKDLPRGTHLTAPEVYRRAKEQGLQVSLSTVYRTLNLLQADGNVTMLLGEHGRRFEARDSEHDHDHLICLKCGLTIEFTDDLIKGFGKMVAERKGYEHRSSRFDILGICGDCKLKDEDHKITMAVTASENVIALTEEAVVNLESALQSLQSRKLPKAQENMAAAIRPLRDALDELVRSLEVVEQQDTAYIPHS